MGSAGLFDALAVYFTGDWSQGGQGMMGILGSTTVLLFFQNGLPWQRAKTVIL